MTTTFSPTGRPTSIAEPLRHLILYANPDPESFDHAVLEAYQGEVARRGQEAVVRDLNAMGFDPVLKAAERPSATRWAPSEDVAAELQHVHQCDALVMIYPIWFGLPPAILKGYVDRVLGAGFSFRNLEHGRAQPALQGKYLLSFSTSGTSLAWLSERGQPLALREIFDVYLWRGFGMRQSEHIMIESVVPNMSAAYAQGQLERVRNTAERMCSTLASNRHAAHTAEVMARRAGRGAA